MKNLSTMKIFALTILFSFIIEGQQLENNFILRLRMWNIFRLLSNILLNIFDVHEYYKKFCRLLFFAWVFGIIRKQFSRYNSTITNVIRHLYGDLLQSVNIFLFTLEPTVFPIGSKIKDKQKLIMLLYPKGCSKGRIPLVGSG